MGTTPGDPRGGEWAWLAPSLGYVVVAGLLGVTTKLALEDLRWEQIVLWATVAYTAFAVLLAAAGKRLSLDADGAWGAASGVLAVGALIALFLALETGEVSRVVPITASYPVITLLAAAVVLSERVDALRIWSTLGVIAGVILLSLE